MKKEKKKTKEEVSPEVLAERTRSANETLRAELDTLRVSLSAMVDSYKVKVDQELTQLADATNGNGSDGTNSQLPVRVAESMLKDIRALDIKAHKGRAKDFPRVQELIDELIEQLPSAG